MLGRQAGNMVNYTLGDFLVQIKNAARAHLHEVSVKNTKAIERVARVLEKEGFLESVTKDDKSLNVRLVYHKKEPILVDLKLVSKPGLRVYAAFDKIKSKKGVSVWIISTSKGVMSSTEALKKKIGGEIIAEVI